MMKSKLLAILLCAVLLISIAACGGSSVPTTSEGGESPTGSAPPATPSGGGADTPDAPSTPDAPVSVTDTVNVAITADDGTLAAEYLMTGTYMAMSAVMEPLWDVTEANEVIMVLAESVEWIDDAHLTVHLRQGVKFSNGNPFTASDILFSLGLYKVAGMTGQPRVQTIDPEKTKVIDDHTLDLQLIAPSVAHWQILSQFFIYDEESYDQEKNSREPIGTGPYKLTEYIPNSSIKLERNEAYWGELPDIKNINFTLLAEPSQRVNALDTGLVDIAPIAIEDVEYIESLPGVNLDSRFTQSYTMLGFNFGAKSAFYKNVDARQAIIHAIDPQVILDVVYLGQGEVMHAAVPDICFDYEDRFNDLVDTYAIGYDVELAKQLAQSSGLAGQTISLMTAGTSDAIKMAEIVQSMVSEIGVTVEINNYDNAIAWQMAYDPESDYDFSIGVGIAPNRVVGDLLLNGVRYFPQLNVPGAFEGNMEYLERAPLTMSTIDEQERSELLYDLLRQYEENVIQHAMCNILVSNAYSTVIDPGSIVYSVGTGFVRLQDLKLAS
ncbi:MAG: ABC transporter substrate-binding protein [Oscillospiraceae bacterium]|jgi:peptide/nickel transport system substrate-binding protein|nr:ABC transporter substrate-binding protein [Oscillospiraceae bacterium]